MNELGCAGIFDSCYLMTQNCEGRSTEVTRAQGSQAILKRETGLTYGTRAGSGIVLGALAKSGAWAIYLLIMCLQDQGITEPFPRAFR